MSRRLREGPPTLAGVPEPVRQRLIIGGALDAAARAAGVQEFQLRYYRAIPEWVAGYALMTAT